MYKAILFSRVSTEHQDLVQQSDEVLDEALKYGYKKEECIFIEYKESAIKLSEEEREGLNEMKSKIEQLGTIEVVFVYELSRISRQAKMIYSIRDYLIERRIQLVCIKPHFELIDKKTGKISDLAHMVFGVFVGLAESEMSLKKARMRRGVEKKKSLGYHAGSRVMFGYKTEKTENGHRYILDQFNAGVVRRIFNDYADGKSMRKLTRDLQEEGIFSNVKFLTAQQEVYNILHRDCYCGRKKGMPAIISEELYDKTAQMRKDNMLKINHCDNMAMLKGLLKDVNSGLLLSSNMAAKMYYSKRQSGVAVGMHIIEPIIWDIVVELHKNFITMDKEQMLEELNKKMQRNERKIYNLTIKKYDIIKQRDKIEERLIKGRLSDSKADELHRELDKEENENNMRLAELMKIKNEIVDDGNKIEKAKNIEIDYDNAGMIDRYNITHSVINKIILSRNEGRYILQLDIYNKLNDEIRVIKYDTYNKKKIDDYMLK